MSCAHLARSLWEPHRLESQLEPLPHYDFNRLKRMSDIKKVEPTNPDRTG